MPDFSDSVNSGQKIKNGEKPSVLDWSAKGDARDVVDAVFASSSATVTSATAAFTTADVGKVVIAWGSGTSGDIGIIRDGRANWQTSTATWAAFSGTEIDSIDCQGALSLVVRVKSGFFNVSWRVVGDDDPGFGSATVVHGPAAATADATATTVTLSSLAYRYYRIEIQDTVSGTHGNFWAYAAANGYILYTTVQSVESSTEATLTDVAGATTAGVRMRIATDNRVAIQAALDAICDRARTLHFPSGARSQFQDIAEGSLNNGRYYVSDTLLWKGQSLSGDGPQHSILVGAPGKDVLRAPDPSIDEDGSLDELPFSIRISGLRIEVDNTMDTSSAFDGRKAFPVHRAWDEGQTTEYYEWTSNGGRIYMALENGTTGASGPVHTDGAASDGGVRWLHIGQQHTYGNAAIALPLRDPSSGSGSSHFVISPVLDQVEVWSTTQKINWLGSTGIFTQRPFDGARIESLKIHQTTYGWVEAPPADTLDYYYPPDVNRFSNVKTFCKKPARFFNGTHNCISVWQVAAVEIECEGVDILGFRDLNGIRRLPSEWTLRSLYVEPSPAAAKRENLIMGYMHQILVGTLKVGLGNGHFSELFTDNTMIRGGFYANDGITSCLRLYGNRNDIRDLAVFQLSNFVSDYGRGNRVSASRLLTDVVTPVDREWMLNHPRAAVTGERRADFITHASPTAWRSNEDLLLAGAECFWVNGGDGDAVTPSLDATSEVNSYVTIEDNWYTYEANKESLLIATGGRIPPVKVTFIYKVRTSAQCTIYIQPSDTIPPSAPPAIESDTFPSTGGLWTIRRLSADLTAYAGNYLVFNVDGEGGDVDLAWWAIAPAYGQIRAQHIQADSAVIGADDLLALSVGGHAEFARSVEMDRLGVGGSPPATAGHTSIANWLGVAAARTGSNALDVGGTARVTGALTNDPLNDDEPVMADNSGELLSRKLDASNPNHVIFPGAGSGDVVVWVGDRFSVVSLSTLATNLKTHLEHTHSYVAPDGSTGMAGTPSHSHSVGTNGADSGTPDWT